MVHYPPGYYAKSNPTAKRDLDKFDLPLISQNLDSIRAYQWEIHFTTPAPTDIEGSYAYAKPLTLAAKQVSQIGFTIDDIEVHRVNDKVFYPGKSSPDELVVTFDNLRAPETSAQLYRWMQSIYNPKTGEFTNSFNTTPSNFKRKMQIYQLGADMEPISATIAYAAYPKTWKLAEFNYSTNEFHTVEATFRFDFLEQEPGKTLS